MTTLRFTGGHIALPGTVADAVTLRIEYGRIATIGAGDPDITIDLAGGWLAPGFVDTQVNGGGGVLLNNDVSIEGIAAIARAHRAFGTTALLPTLISETPDCIAATLDAVDAAIAAGVPGIVGVHIEGPVLNPARKGIHDAGRFQDLDAPLLDLLTQPRRGRVMVTLAPERVSDEVIRALVAAGVRVSAGHSEASHERTRAAFDAGLSGITHLFNAMPPMHQRAPGLVGAALDDPRPWCGLIVDGVHVAAPVLRVALAARGAERMMLVTDAMSSVGAVDKDFVLDGRRIAVKEGICRFEDGTLAGSDLDMASAVRNTVDTLGVAPATALAMASAHPAAFLGLERELGTIAVGARADLVWLDAGFRTVATWIGGAREDAA